MLRSKSTRSKMWFRLYHKEQENMMTYFLLKYSIKQLILFHWTCWVFCISPITCSTDCCRNMRPHLFLIILCLGMILPYLPGRRESDPSRSLPRSTLLSSLPPLTPRRISFNSSPRRWLRSCQEQNFNVSHLNTSLQETFSNCWNFISQLICKLKLAIILSANNLFNFNSTSAI
jgi:hypothetical protein